jgi:cathepsin F
MYKGYKPGGSNASETVALYPKKDLPQNFDWRERGVVSEVKNQGQCGSCWSFSTTGAIESKLAIRTGELVTFSEQQLVDCDKTDDGCKGGLPENAYKYIASAGGIKTDQQYPYKATEGSCSFTTDKADVQIKGSRKIPADEATMAEALINEGPLSIGLNAHYMQFYSGGISDPVHCDSQMDHAVLIVGFGVENEVPYWIIKNSWGPDWGEAGYYRIVRGKGMCGLAQDVTNPQIE